jgi:hypothetical protein
MAKSTRVSVAGRNAAIDALTALLNGGRIEIRSGTKPADVATAPPDGVVLSDHTLGATAFAAAAAASANANAIGDDLVVNATGQASWYRAYRSAGNGGAAVIDGTVGEAADNTNMTIDNKSMVAGIVASITAWSISLPDTGA